MEQKTHEKYLLVDETIATGERVIYLEVYDTFQEANKEAEIEYRHMTKTEKETHRLFVGQVAISDPGEQASKDPDNIDWRNKTIHTDERLFDSDRLRKE
ncbi:MAG: hypothetical protein ACOX2M_03445 [Fastidiosipilaceae bacterium]|jgi:hypothetical protein